MKRIILILIFALLIINGYSCFSQAKLVFDTTYYSYPDIDECLGTFEKEIFYTNISKEPVIITNVRGSGVLAFHWDKSKIIPKERKSLKFYYPAKGRPGTSTKTIDITYRKLNSSIEESISVEVHFYVIECKKEDYSNPKNIEQQKH